MANPDRQTLLNQLKIEFRGILLSAGHNGVKISELERDYKDLNGRPIPYAELGYNHINQFLFHEMKDVCTFWQDYFGAVVLFPVSHESTQHLERLIAGQRISRTSRFGGQIPQPAPPQRSTSRYNFIKPLSSTSHRGARSAPPRHSAATGNRPAAAGAASPAASKGQQSNKASANSASSTAKRPATASANNGVGSGAPVLAPPVPTPLMAPSPPRPQPPQATPKPTAADTVLKLLARTPVSSTIPVYAGPSLVASVFAAPNTTAPMTGPYIAGPSAYQSPYNNTPNSYIQATAPPHQVQSMAFLQPPLLATPSSSSLPFDHLPSSSSASALIGAPSAGPGPSPAIPATAPTRGPEQNPASAASSSASLLEQIKSSVEKITLMPMQNLSQNLSQNLPSSSSVSPLKDVRTQNSAVPASSESTTTQIFGTQARTSTAHRSSPAPSAAAPASAVQPKSQNKAASRRLTPDEIKSKNPELYEKIKQNVEKLLNRYSRRGINYELFPQVYELECEKLPNTVEALFDVTWRELVLSTNLCYIDQLDIMRPKFTTNNTSSSNPSLLASRQTSAGPSPAKHFDRNNVRLPLNSPPPASPFVEPCSSTGGPPAPISGSSRKPQDVRNWINESKGKQFFENDNTPEMNDTNYPESITGSTKSKRSTENNDLERLRRNCKKVLRKYPSGIRHHDFAMAYSRIIGEPLNLDSLNIFSVVELVDLFPDVFAQDTSSSDLMILNNTTAYEDHDQSHHFTSVLPRQKLPQKDIFEALMLQWHSPDHFYLQLKAYEIHLNELMRDLNEYLERGDASAFRIPGDQLKPGLICSAWYVENGWHRAEILSIDSFTSIKCFYVDFGTEAPVNFDKLRILPKQFYSLPAQAIKARLSCIKPINGKDYSLEACEKFAELTFNKTFWVTPTPPPRGSEDDGVLNVIITLTDQETDLHVNDVLVLEGHASLLYEQNAVENEQTMQQNNHEVEPEAEIEAPENKDDEILSDEDFEYYSAQADVSNNGPANMQSNGIEDEEVINSEDEEVLMDGFESSSDSAILLPDLEVEMRLMKRAQSAKCLTSVASLSVIRTVLLLRRTSMLRESMNNGIVVPNLVDKMKWLENAINWLTARIGDSVDPDPAQTATPQAAALGGQ